MANIQWAALLEPLIPLLYVAAVALLATILIQAKAVLAPVALAILLAFILTPLVEALERRRLPRIVAVATVVLLALGVLGGFGYVLTRQLNRFICFTQRAVAAGRSREIDDARAAFHAAYGCFGQQQRRAPAGNLRRRDYHVRGLRVFRDQVSPALQCFL